MNSPKARRPGSRGVPTQSKAAALARLHADIRGCQRCPLWRTRVQAVPGVGPATARIVFVGEAPGRHEDRQGEPFVGAAGRFLDELLASVGLRRDHVFITNVVKSRPVAGPLPGRNRAPTGEELDACAPWLEEQLRILKPAVVVTLGRIALERFLPGKRISEVHGRSYRRGTMTILPLYHPAMALYRRDRLEILRQDFRQIPRLLQRRQERPARTQNRSRHS